MKGNVNLQLDKTNLKENYIAYFDETGDDGNNTNSSETFLLTSIYMPICQWVVDRKIMKL